MRGRLGIRAAALAFLLALAAGAGRTGEPSRAEDLLDGRTARVAECTLGDLVADGVRASLKADLALVQAGQLRADAIPAEEVSQERLEALLLYPDEPIVLVEMEGRLVLGMLEHGLSALPRPSAAFLQVSGVTVTFRSANQPGQRVDSVQVGRSALGQGTKYRVAMPSSLAKGALGYFRVLDGLKPKETGPGIGAAVTAYARTTKDLNIRPGLRLRDLSRSAGEGEPAAGS